MWPKMKGRNGQDVVDMLSKCYSDLAVDLLEVSPKDCGVVSWDQTHKKAGYSAKSVFFGCYEDDLHQLRKGDRIKLIGTRDGDKEFTFSHVGGQRGHMQKVDGRMVRYLYIKDDALRIIVRDGMVWRKVMKTADPTFNPNRVCVYYDPVTNKVADVPRTG